MARFALAPHVFTCLAGDHVVVLDLERDEYFAIDAIAAAGLSSRIQGWPSPASTVPCVPSGARKVQNLLSRLQERGLLADTARCGVQRQPQAVPAVSHEFTLDFGTRPSCGWRDVLCVLRAVLLATFLLKCVPLHRIATRVGERRRAAVTMTQLAELQRRVLVFEYLRPLFLGARGACLLESLALLEFLARHQCHPHWVFGVRTRPFAAHCWVQQDAYICNDSCERVCRFTPIAAI
jgi:hypothetical protein